VVKIFNTKKPNFASSEPASLPEHEGNFITVPLMPVEVEPSADDKLHMTPVPGNKIGTVILEKIPEENVSLKSICLESAD